MHARDRGVDAEFHLQLKNGSEASSTKRLSGLRKGFDGILPEDPDDPAAAAFAEFDGTLRLQGEHGLVDHDDGDDDGD